MITFVRSVFLGFLLSTAAGWSALQAASLSGYPQATATFEQGFQAGVAQGQEVGFSAGYDTAVGTCQADPATCGISLGACLAAPQFGETEPNDNIVSADPLVLDTPYWGQSYGLDDLDWFYLTTTAPNQNLIINFSVPNGSLSGWEISVRDAAGNVFAKFQTDQVPAATSSNGDITYRTTLGLVGTYYIVIRPRTLNFNAYQLTAILQQSPLEAEQSVIGFFDAETEPNNHPGSSNSMATGVSMYGLINLNFRPGSIVSDPDGDGYEYTQASDEDWYHYWSNGNEIIALSICSREVCTEGSWLFEVFDPTSAYEVADGKYAAPLLAVNSERGASNEFVLGLRDAGYYYIRVTHKRLLAAPCTSFSTDTNNNGLPGPNAEPCACATGSSCDIDIRNPQSADAEGNYPLCPDGSGGGEVAQCSIGCLCTGFGGVIEVPANALTSEYNFTLRSTYLPPNTTTSDAYQEFLNRANPYTP